MNRGQLYHVSMGIVGLSVGFAEFIHILTQGVHLGASLMAVGALVLLVHAGYSLVVAESAELKSGQNVVIAVGSAILCSSGAVLQFVVY
ncbi:hypothetical protein [Haloterrigena salifodinae]|uniref:Uncharacterized protein n=1 Tax=Haloterrigena salifodinae TaxID=2675099 RepID=A0A8T8DXS9_9EURY|nr:hypothetical protein [Haloterrigena salifodinae]QRV13956.1 hypothetical protein JMJ58_13500 [Haloterrigena salifodinae]